MSGSGPPARQRSRSLRVGTLGCRLQVLSLLSVGCSLQLDDTDQRIIALLVAGARASYADIGAEVSLSAPAVKRRVDRLRAAKVIRGYTAIIDPAALGWTTEAFVELFCTGRTTPVQIAAAAKRHPNVVGAYTVSGEPAGSHPWGDGSDRFDPAGRVRLVRPPAGRPARVGEGGGRAVRVRRPGDRGRRGRGPRTGRAGRLGREGCRPRPAGRRPRAQ